MTAGKTPPVAVVTGAGQGIGRAIARVLCDEGYRVVVVDRRLERAQRTVGEIGDDRALALEADVGEERAVAQVADQVIEELGRWDVLVNNAGALRFGGVESTSLEDWNAVLHGCVTTAWLCTRAAVPYLRQSPAGRVVNIASVVAHGAESRDLVAYASAKAAMIGLTRASARELGSAGITVNAISPGAVETEAWGKFGDVEALRESRAQAAVVGRVAEPWEVGKAVAYLVSPAAGFVTGHVLVLDGGRIDKL
jgi:3-oxoacyl-[acyl-carrier protein] reductase